MKKITRTQINALAQQLGGLEQAVRTLLPKGGKAPAPAVAGLSLSLDELLAGDGFTAAVDEEEAGNEPLCGKPDTVGIAAALVKTPFPAGELAGVGCTETGYYYYFDRADAPGAVLPEEDNTFALVLPPDIYDALIKSDVVLDGYTAVGSFLDGENLTLRQNTQGYPFENTIVFEPEEVVFSRNRTVCDVNTLKQKTVVMVGCGSIGATAAVYFARSGVGKFILIDQDTLKPHNLVRHELTRSDLGRFKVTALAEKIRKIDLSIQVETFPCSLAEAKEHIVLQEGEEGLVFASADSRRADAQANELAEKYHLAYVCSGAHTRAEIGEVFYWQPGKKQRTYGEVFGKLIQREPAVRDSAHDYYVGQREKMELVHYEPAMFVDITYLTLAGVRLGLDLLQLDNTQFSPRLLDHVKRFNLWCNTLNTQEPSRELFDAPLSLVSFDVEGDPKEES